ncbi:hypothetical protein G6F35_015889 [Rhizopus arrhizus]|nr:hypothetical protein G6F35_015889 [Rhizopus arrhizus]
MRWARLTDANPPNTTECTAPIRAQASIVNTASGTIGMYSSTRSPRPTPNVLPGVDLFPVDFGGHPDQGRLVSLRRQPPVDRVVAKIGLAAYKPLGEWRPREVQDRLEGRLPVYAARLFAPEAIAVMQ